MNRLIQPKATTSLFIVALLLACFGVLPRAQAVVPPPDGGYPNFTTAEGQNALLSLTTGAANTAVGWFSLSSNIEGDFNTATGAAALLLNTADENTAFGAATLLFNADGTQNTAVGVAALLDNTIGEENTATGAFALSSNTDGNDNTAIGAFALHDNTTGFSNTASGFQALFSNTGGFDNTAVGINALVFNTTGSSNTALGNSAGFNVTTADHVICIGANVQGENVSNTCYIGNIFGVTSTGGAGVFVNANGKLGTITSSRRFKDGIKPMDSDSEALFALKPVSFRYKQEVDPARSPQFGLVAEDVEKVNPDLVVRDKDGKPYTVRYDQVNAMLLNEFLKEHRKNEEQQAMIARLEKQVEALTGGLQKVSAQLEANKPAPQVVNNP